MQGQGYNVEHRQFHFPCVRVVRDCGENIARRTRWLVGIQTWQNVICSCRLG